MRLFNNLDRYLTEENYKIIILDNKININNYIEIIDFSTELIKVKHKNGITVIKGKNLCVCKMLDNEVLIEGNISSLTLS